MSLAEALEAGEKEKIVSWLRQQAPKPVIERLIDTVYNDPRVHQLWGF